MPLANLYFIPALILTSMACDRRIRQSGLDLVFTRLIGSEADANSGTVSQKSLSGDKTAGHPRIYASTKKKYISKKKGPNPGLNRRPLTI